MTMCTEMNFRTCRPSCKRSTMWFRKSEYQTSNYSSMFQFLSMALLILPVIVLSLLPSAITPVIVLLSVILFIISLINVVLISL